MARKPVRFTFDGGSTYDGTLTTDPRMPINRDAVLWCVYGPDCFPSVLCCKISTSPLEGHRILNIWGYSVYRNSPGFRTLGQALDKWLEKNPEARFFRVRNEALAYIAGLVTPPDRLLD